MKQIRKRLTYANVMASVAVFLVLGGATAFAALGKNTVGSKQLKKNAVTAAKIKKNAVTGAKVKDQSITGKDINLAKLGTVPSATNAGTAANATNATTAATANALSALEATHLVGAPGQPGFEGGSGNAIVEGSPLSFQPVGFFKDHEGIVHLDGVAEVGEAPPLPGVIFTLPPGFRPASGKIQVYPGLSENIVLVIGSNVVVEGVDLSGKVVSTAGEPATLSGVTFKAES